MPLKNGRFTRMETRFIDQMSRTGDATYAAAKAGYKMPEDAGRHLLRRDAVKAATYANTCEHLETVVFSKAAMRVEGIIESLTSNPKDVIAGFNAVARAIHQARGEGTSQKPIEECTPEELQAVIDQSKAFLADLARPVIQGETLNSPPDMPSAFD